MTDRVGVRKTYKLYLGGEFPRSESGRTYEAVGHDGELLAHAVRASRKDVRDAVVAARKAFPSWAGKTAYNRGQILYRIAEMMETRRLELIEEVHRAEGAGPEDQVERAIDCWVYYAGLADKLAQITGGVNPVAGPYFNITVPEPIGVTGIAAPARPSVLGLVARLAPALCAGNTVVVLASEPHPLPAITVAECLATSDVPKGVVNVLTGLPAELLPVLAGHLDVDAIDLTGVTGEASIEAETLAADNVKQVIRGGQEPSPYEAAAFTEMKTVWHPKGA
jgi:acyl-CoA reductase-like NAD-dependent aldehyde dehydrogenase